MLFHSLQYAAFLPITWLLFRLTPSRWRVELLLAASYTFYAFWSVPYAALMFLLAVANYLFGLAIVRASRHKRLILWTCIATDICVLGAFKYLNFFLDSGSFALQSLFGLSWDPPLLQILLPLGISFFTFEFIHYLVDTYRGHVPAHSFSKFHVFVAFFPTQIAGPIKRFQQFVPGLATLDRFDAELAKDGLRLIALGLGKKILLADKLGPIADAGFTAAAHGDIGTWEAWAAALAFALQIYFDFSGYTDIARGSAQLFGFHIPINFNAPYLATSVSDFWRRWHISLSSWLRDYVFVPLGGSKRGLPRTLGNLLATMILGGLWHGAGWHFVVWGLYWGVALGLHRLMQRWLNLPQSIGITAFGWLVTQVIVMTGWVLFRSEDLPHAGRMLQAMLMPTSARDEISAGAALYVLAVAGLMLIATVISRRKLWPSLAPSLRPAFVGAGIALAIAYAVVAEPIANQRFIYFQF